MLVSTAIGASAVSLILLAYSEKGSLSFVQGTGSHLPHLDTQERAVA